MPKGLDKLAGAIGDTLKTAPTLYEDGLKPATQESGKTLALIPRAINAALLPLRQWIAEREYKLAETEKLLTQKLEHVGEDKIVTPEAYVAVPAIQAIAYSMDSEELRNLYANLLAKAMNSDTKELVHPSFVEIIKQMSPIDSLVFKIIMKRDVNPLIDLVYKNNKNVLRHIISNISDIDIASQETVCISIDNLVRLGLICIPDARRHYADDNAYNEILNSPYYIAKQYLYPTTPDGFTLSYKKRMIDKTNLGLSFFETCVIELET